MAKSSHSRIVGTQGLGTGAGKPEYSGPRQAEGVEFKGANGGLVSETRYKRPLKTGGHDYQTETGIHPNLEHAAEHLKSVLGQHLPKAGGAGIGD